MSESHAGTRRWPLRVNRHRVNGVLVLALEGRLGARSVPTLRSELVAAIGEGSRTLVVDLARIDYLSSPGLRLLNDARGRLDASGGRLVLCALAEPVQLVFDLAGLTALFTIEATLERALESAAGRVAPSDSGR